MEELKHGEDPKQHLAGLMVHTSALAALPDTFAAQERFLTVMPALRLLPKHMDTLCGRMLSEGAGPVGALFQTTALFLALRGAATRCGGESPVTPRGGESPVTPSGGESPVTPSGGESPVTPSGGESPVTPSGDESPVTPSGDESPVTPSGGALMSP
ncbi:hypothetical protein E5288_WYG005145 [Bos mutus]|uniref:Uncharacterized protein n=1 Tax=Bos mutus TaxID=72004 RepID=A0A6B0RYV0_9CETA|nr:hypothetical protein [Bos mutus]